MSDDLAIRLARVVANAAGGVIEMYAMIAANAEREEQGKAPAYSEASFRKLITDRGLYWHAIVEDTRP